MESTNDIKTLIESFENGCAIFWLHDKIVVKDCSAGMAGIDQNALVECRVFNEQKEILIRQRGDTFWHRTKEDTGEYITTTAKVRGEIATQLKGDDFKGIIHLVKREYIDYNEQGAATYVDSRFVGFEIK